MNEQETSSFRKTIIVLLTIAFGGSLLVYTAQANLDLLKSIYPDPKFYMFGLLALEGGTVYWTGYYMLTQSGIHKAIALFSLSVDAILAGTGFFYEMEQVTSKTVLSLPPIILIIGFAVAFNVAMNIVVHLLPDGMRPSWPFRKRIQVENRPNQLEKREINLITDNTQVDSEKYTHNGAASDDWGGSRPRAGRNKTNVSRETLKED